MGDSFKGKNRRNAQRQDAAFTLSYGIEKPYALRVSLGLTDDLDAIMADLSDSGVAMITKYDLPKGAQLRIRFNFMNLFLTGQDRSRRMEITGEVVSRAQLSGTDYRVGIRFNQISEADQVAIRNFIKRSR